MAIDPNNITTNQPQEDHEYARDPKVGKRHALEESEDHDLRQKPKPHNLGGPTSGK